MSPTLGTHTALHIFCAQQEYTGSREGAGTPLGDAAEARALPAVSDPQSLKCNRSDKGHGEW